MLFQKRIRMRNLTKLFLVLMACCVMSGCGDSQVAPVTKDLTNADIESYADKIKREEEETAAGL
jgi:uncharacterized protein YceK